MILSTIILLFLNDSGYHASSHYNICIDSSFSEHDHALILSGMSVWNIDKQRFTETYPCTCYINKATEFQDKIEKADHIGYTDFFANETVIFDTRVSDDNSFRWIVSHELGHALGLEHTDENQPAIMNATIRRDVANDLKIYPNDWNQLCDLWSCE